MNTHTSPRCVYLAAGLGPRVLLYLCSSVFIGGFLSSAFAAEAPGFAAVQAIFKQHCLACHDQKEADGDLVLDSFAALMKGGESGVSIVPGKADESLLVKLIERREKPYMPPPKKGDKLSDAEIATIKSWINAGAQAGDLQVPRPDPINSAVPKIAPRVAPKPSIQSLAFSPKSKLIAVARLDTLELLAADTRAVKHTLRGHLGRVNDVAFSPDGRLVASASGEAGVKARIVIHDTASAKLVATLEGHTDAAYAVAFSPDGKLLASGGYDQRVILWDLAAAKPLRTLEGHNGAVFSLSFRGDGKVLASASADRTIKLWSVATGERLDTLEEPTKEQQAVAFSPDGSHLAAAGVDNRIRLYRISAKAIEGENALLLSRYAHDGAILRLAYSPDGKTLLSTAENQTVKLWDTTRQLEQKLALPPQADWPTGAALTDQHILIGLLDGSLAQYSMAGDLQVPRAAPKSTATPAPARPMKKAAAAPGKPVITTLTPRSVQRGSTATLTVTGKELAELKSAAFHGPAPLNLKVLKSAATSAQLQLTIPADYPAGIYEISLEGAKQRSDRTALAIDDLPQSSESEPNDSPAALKPLKLPAVVLGSFMQRGDVDHYSFDGEPGRTIVIDAAAKRLGSKADVVLSLLGPGGDVIASNSNFDGDADPLLAYTIRQPGRYTVRVAELMAAGSAEHHYRLAIGAFPFVTGVHPLAISANKPAKVQLLGFNLPGAAALEIPASPAGEITVPRDPSMRGRRDLKLLVTAGVEELEAEPNDKPAQASVIHAPGAVNGRIDRAGDADLFRFTAKKNQRLIIETVAAQRGSPIDTQIEILDAAGRPVPRMLLQAVRDSSITFRPIEAANGGARLVNGEEMDLRQYLYMNGEVVRLFLAPRGPDSEWKFYPASAPARRRTYFDTSPIAHPLDETCYIVEPRPLGAKLPVTGLPVFTLNYANDDEAMRRLGSDSCVDFTAPADGEYLVRVADTRGFGGERHVYRLVLRDAKPDFTVSFQPASITAPRGGGAAFEVRVDRQDGFDGPIRVEITGAPAGVTVASPVIVEAGHTEASGVVFVDPAYQAANMQPLMLKATASAMIGGKEVSRPVAMQPRVTVGAPPRVEVFLRPVSPAGKSGEKPVAELTIAPGQEIAAQLSIQRNNFTERVSFELENAPHGVIVSDIGLSGVLIPEGQTQRQIFITCAKWVEDQDRLVFMKVREAPLGNVTTAPVLLKVRTPKQAAR